MPTVISSEDGNGESNIPMLKPPQAEQTSIPMTNINLLSVTAPFAPVVFLFVEFKALFLSLGSNAPLVR